jgi:hypothetical protein
VDLLSAFGSTNPTSTEGYTSTVSQQPCNIVAGSAPSDTRNSGAKAQPARTINKPMTENRFAF